MKNLWKKHKVLLIVVPIVLAAGAGVLLYFMIHRAQVVNASIETGDRCLSELDYEQAIVSYKQALKVDEKNYKANLGLAEAYTSSEMYSYAEAVYQSMLERDEKQADVYELLAELYLSQNKLEEAKDLLEQAKNKVDDDRITELYYVTRPEVPTVSHESGEYDDRIRVELIPSADEQTIYYTMDGTEPTEESAVYTEPFILRNGTTTIKAMVTNSAGYQSDIAVYEYELNIRDVEITLEEPVIEQIIRSRLEIPAGTPILNEDIEQITELYIVGESFHDASDTHTVSLTENEYIVDGYSYAPGTGQIETLNDLQYMPFLERVAVVFQDSLDISMIDRCGSVKELSLVGDNLTNRDIVDFGAMTQLEKLNLGWNHISDASPLSGLTNLTSLSMWGNNLSSAEAFSGLTGLTYLDFSDNQVRDLSPLGGLTSLVQLWMYGNQAESLAPLESLPSLRVLMLKGNPISDIESVRAIYPRLERIDEDLLGLGGDTE